MKLKCILLPNLDPKCIKRVKVQMLLHKSCPSGSQFSANRTKKKTRNSSVTIVKCSWIKNKDAPLQNLKKKAETKAWDQMTVSWVSSPKIGL